MRVEINVSLLKNKKETLVNSVVRDQLVWGILVARNRIRMSSYW